MTTTDPRLASALTQLRSIMGGSSPAPAQPGALTALAQLQRLSSAQAPAPASGSSALEAWKRQNANWAADPSSGLFRAGGAPVYWQPTTTRVNPSALPPPPPAPPPAPVPAPPPSSVPGPAQGMTPAPSPAPAPSPTALTTPTPTTPMTPGGNVSLAPAPAPTSPYSLAAPVPAPGGGTTSPSLIPSAPPPTSQYALDPTGVHLGTGGETTPFNTGLSNRDVTTPVSLLLGPQLGALAGLLNAGVNAVGAATQPPIPAPDIPPPPVPPAPAPIITPPSPSPSPAPDYSLSGSLGTTPQTSLAPPPTPPASPYALGGSGLRFPSLGSITPSLATAIAAAAAEAQAPAAPVAPPPAPSTPAPAPYVPNMVRTANTYYGAPGVSYDANKYTVTPITEYKSGSGAITTGYTIRDKSTGAVVNANTSTSPARWYSGSSSSSPYSLSGTNAALGDTGTSGSVTFSTAPAQAPASQYSLTGGSFNTGGYGGRTDSGDGMADGGSVLGYDDPERVLMDMLREHSPEDDFDAYGSDAPDLADYRRRIASAMLNGDPEGAKSLRSMAKRYADMFKKE